MTKKELLKKIESAPDDAVVLSPSSDHSYRVANVSVDTAIRYNSMQYDEDHGDDHDEGGTRVKAIIIE